MSAGRRALVLLVVVGVAAGVGIPVQQHRAAAQERDRKQAAARVVTRAEAAYRTALVPLLPQVFDATQPLQDSFDAFAKPSPSQHQSQYDVVRHSGALAALKRVDTAISTVPVPPSLSKRRTSLKAALAGFEVSATKLTDAANAKSSRNYVGDFEFAYGYLTSAESVWITAVTDLLGDKYPVALPSPDRAASRGRSTPTHGSYIQQADDFCGIAGSEYLALGDFTSPTAVRRKTARFVALLQRLTTHLQQVKAPADAASVGHRITVLLKGESATLEPGITAFAKAVRERDPAAARVAQAKILEGVRLGRDLSAIYRSYGVTVCADFFAYSGTAPQGGLAT